MVSIYTTRWDINSPEEKRPDENMRQKICGLTGLVVWIALAISLARAADHALFYKGKTVRLIVGPD
jgi:hypothetical protein